MDKEHTPSRTATINMYQLRKDYNKVKAMTKTTHERYILEIFRGYIVENAISMEYAEMKMKNGSEYGLYIKDGDIHE